MFDFRLELTKFRWSWVFRLRFNRRELRYDEGLWEYDNGWGKKGKHYSWGERRVYPLGTENEIQWWQKYWNKPKGETDG